MKKTPGLLFKVDRPPVLVWRQIAAQLREGILSGALAVGTKLPATTELAKSSHTNVKTINRALADLVKEGLIIRTRKVGTYVTGKNASLSFLGIYHPARADDDHPRGRFMQTLHAELQKQAHAQRIETRVWLDHRPEKKQETAPLPALEEAARARQIDGVITTVADPKRSEWLSKLPTATAYLGANHPSSVSWDFESLFELSLRHMLDQGCKTVGLITAHPRENHRFFDRFLKKAEELGLSTQPSWTLCPDGPMQPEDGYEAFGYKSFKKIWDQRKRPDGLLVYPDTMARGVVMSAMVHQVNTPKDLVLVLHKNKEMELFCPFKAAFIVSSAAQAAEALLQQVKEVYQGRPVSTKLLPFSLVA